MEVSNALLLAKPDLLFDTSVRSLEAFQQPFAVPGLPYLAIVS
jgi:hypothetical protein